MKLTEELDNWICGYTFPEKLLKEYSFETFVDALKFVNKVGAISEKINHHPDIQLWGAWVYLRVWTRDVGGLTELDFTLAKEIDNVDK
jgi:4a-hydroxytetrahydrobiopterin dehydratase